MTEDRFDEVLRDALADYNRPPEPPRDAMWRRIEAARQEQVAAAAPVARRAIGAPRWVPWAVGLAATLVVGIGLGRLSIGRNANVEGTSQATSPVTSPAAATLAAGNAPGATSPGAASPGAADADAADAGGGSDVSPLRDDGAQRVALGPDGSQSGTAGRVAATRSVGAEPLLGAPADARNAGGRAAPTRSEGVFRLAANQTLGQAEALLTAVRTSPADSATNAQLSSWARQVLSATRVLMDSPAAKDPQMAGLLDDLELVLVQIVQLSSPEAGGERQLIDDALRQNDVLPRLRSAVPAGSGIAAS